MKYTALTMVLVFFLMSFFVIAMKQAPEDDIKEEQEETRAVYLSYIEFNSYIKDKNSNTSKENIQKILDNVKDFGFNTLILHVRPFADSIYKSEYFPISNTVLNDQGTYPDYDILEYFIEEGHKRELKIEAWINPFRISNITDVSTISVDSPYYKFVKNNDAKIIDEKGIYLNPASKDVQELIINGIKEIVKKYDIDGIHFDDYFYPDKTIDLKSYEEYQANGGTLAIDDYRLNNISTLIKNAYSAIKEIKPKVLFGIAPEGNIENNYEKNYIDIKKILSNKGYIDYIMPQIYYGFKNETKPFIDTVNIWNSLIEIDDIKLIPALAFYKIGNIDKYAGTGENEWIENSDIIKKEILISRNTNRYGGFSLFRYDYLFNEEKRNDNISKEIENIKEILN